MYTGGEGLVCKCPGSVHWECRVWGGCTLESKKNKSHVQYIIKIDQSQITHGKIASMGKMSSTAK